MEKVIVIEEEQLGILAAQVKQLDREKFKKDRKSHHTRLARVLKDLGLVNSAYAIKGLALGARSDGSRSLFIFCEIDQVQNGVEPIDETGNKLMLTTLTKTGAIAWGLIFADKTWRVIKDPLAIAEAVKDKEGYQITYLFSQEEIDVFQETYV